MKEFFKKNITKFQLLFSLFLLNSQVAFAGTIQDSKIVTGTDKLLTDIGKAAMFLSAAVTIALIIVNLVKMQVADDETDVKPIKKRMKVIAICGIAVFCVSSLYTIIIGYYK